MVVVGAGPAGLTASIYTSSLGLRTLVLEGKAPSRLALAREIRNYPGFLEPISGGELLLKFRQQAIRHGAEVKQEEVLSVSLLGPVKTAVTREGTYTSYSVVIAVGINKRKLNIPGEEKFLGLGISYCAICDGPLYKGRSVAVLGDGGEAVEDALMLSNLASRTYLIFTGHLTEEQRGKLTSANVTLLEGFKVKSIEGDEVVRRLSLLKSTGEVLDLYVDAVFIVTEELPLAQLLAKSGVAVDKKGCIKVNRRQETNIEGVYAAGDCTCGGMQVATAVGEGARAAISAASYVRRASAAGSLVY